MRLRHTPNTFFCVKATLNNGSRYCQVLMKFRLRENGKLSFTKNEPFQLRVILLFQLFRATNLLAITIYPKNPPMLTYRYYKLFIFYFFCLFCFLFSTSCFSNVATRAHFTPQPILTHLLVFTFLQYIRGHGIQPDLCLVYAADSFWTYFASTRNYNSPSP